MFAVGSEMLLRKATKKDLQRILSLSDLQSPKKPDLSTGLNVVALADGEVVGFAQLDKGVIYSLIVSKKRRRKKIATKLVFWLLLHSGEREIEAHVLEDNTASQKFFESLGFKKTGKKGKSLVYKLVL